MINPFRWLGRKAVETILSGINISDPRVMRMFGPGPTHAGELVSIDTAMQLSAVWSCATLIAHTVATLPLMIYERDKDDFGVLNRDYPLYPILHDSPNAEMTAVEFWEAMVGSLLLWGNAYAQIIRSGQRVISLIPMRPDRVQFRRETDGSLTYLYSWMGVATELPEDEVFHIKGFSLDGIVGISVIAQGRQVMGTAIAADRASGNFFRNGMRPSGVLTAPSYLTPEQRKRKQEWIDEYSGAINNGKVPLIEGGWKLESISIPPEDAQLLASRQFDIEELCFVPGTEIVTPTGLRPIETLAVGDFVLTHKGRWRAVNRIMRRDYVGPVITLQAKGLPAVTATANHPFLVQRAKPNRSHRIEGLGEPEWLEAGKLEASRAKPDGVRSRRPFHNLVMPRLAPDQAVALDMATYAPVDAAADAATVRWSDNHRATPVVRHPAQGYDLGWLCGLFLADGAVSAHQVIFSLSLHERHIADLVRDRMQAAFDQKVTFGTSGPVLVVRVSNRVLAAFFASFGRSSYRKAAPPWAMQAPAEFRRGMIDGILAGDGHMAAKGESSIRTVSRDLAWQTRLLLWAEGINTCLQYQAASAWAIGGRSGDAVEIWAVSWRTNPARRGTMGTCAEHVFFGLDRADRGTYAGPVYNLSIDEDETFATAGGISHNCRWFHVPPPMIGHTQSATAWGTGLEQMLLWFLQFCLRPQLRRIEARITKSLIPAGDRRTVYAEFNVEGLLRADAKTRAMLYATMVDHGLKTSNEIRSLENDPPMPGGDDLRVNAAMVPLKSLGKTPPKPPGFLPPAGFTAPRGQSQQGGTVAAPGQPRQKEGAIP
jgi:HK97 family phage portal protein